LSALIIDAAGDQSSITMSQIDRSLFEIKDPLDRNCIEKDSYTIFISFLSATVRKTYLRHESGRIKLGKTNQLPLFQQDATFRLLFSPTRNDLIAFESINVPNYYIAVDTETQTALVLSPFEQIQTNIDLLDKRFLFKFIINQ
jgi:hypothetical protein